MADDEKEEIRPLLGNTVTSDVMSRSLRLFTLGFIVFVTFMQTLTYVMTYYAINEYALKWFQDSLYPNTTFHKNQSKCDPDINSSSHEQDHVQSVTSQWSIFASLANGIPVIFTGTIMSSLTDSYGRKRFLIVPLFGTFVKNGLCACAVAYKWNIYVMTAFFFIEGFAGGWVTTLSIASASVADLTPPDKSRSFVLSVMSVGIGLGFVGGTLLSGYILNQNTGYVIPILISTCLSLLAIVLIVFMFKEPLPVSKRTKSVGLAAKIQNMVAFYWKNDGRNIRWRYIITIICFGFIEIGILGKTTVEIYFVSDIPFCLTPLEISLFASLRGIAQELVGTAMLRLLQVCLLDEVITVLGILSGIGYFVVEGTATSNVALFLAPAAGVISILPLTLLRSIMSKMTPPHQQGALFGSIAFFENIYNMSGNVITGAIYSATVDIYKGFVFLVMACMNIIPLVLVLILAIKSRGQTYMYEEIETKEEDAVESQHVPTTNINT